VSAYDSTHDTMAHIARVRAYLGHIINNLAQRGMAHDQSKLFAPEKALFDTVSPLLSSMTYGSEEYKSALERLRPALAHHYAANTHHPEHYADGIAGMSLLDLVEMLADWKAATERHNDGDLAQSLRINQERFGITRQLASVLENTARELGWIQGGADE